MYVHVLAYILGLPHVCRHDISYMRALGGCVNLCVGSTVSLNYYKTDYSMSVGECCAVAGGAGSIVYISLSVSPQDSEIVRYVCLGLSSFARSDGILYSIQCVPVLIVNCKQYLFTCYHQKTC